MIIIGLIAYKIWRVSKAVDDVDGYGLYGPTPKSRVSNVNRIIIDSGMMTTVVTIVVLITYVIGHNSVYITSDFVSSSILPIPRLPELTFG